MSTENAPPAAQKLTPLVSLGLALWLAFALAVGGFGFYYLVPPLVIALSIWTPVLLLLLLFRLSRPFREWAYFLDLRVLILYHLTRFVGIYFLILYGQGRLPYAFAVPGGWGDIAVATAALVVAALCRPLTTNWRWWLVLLWNTCGLMDIALVGATAFRLALADRMAMAEVTKLPLSLLPTFIVPLIVATHLFLFLRLARRK